MNSLLPATWEHLPQRFHERLGDDVGRQRLMEHDGHLLLVLHAPPKPDDDQRTGRFFWRRPDGSWKTTEVGSGIGALEAHLAEFESLLNDAEEEEASAEHAEQYFDLLRRITPVHRAAIHLHAVLQKAREAKDEDERIIRWRDDAYALERRAELVLGETRYGLDFVSARFAEAQAREAQEMAHSSHRLNVLAALFLPAATIASFMGMNVPHGLEDAAAPWTFLAILLLGVVFGVGVKSMLDRPGT